MLYGWYHPFLLIFLLLFIDTITVTVILWVMRGMLTRGSFSNVSNPSKVKNGAIAGSLIGTFFAEYMLQDISQRADIILFAADLLLLSLVCILGAGFIFKWRNFEEITRQEHLYE